MATNGTMLKRLRELYRRVLGRMGMLNSELWGVCQARQQAQADLQPTLEPMEPRLLLSSAPVWGSTVSYSATPTEGTPFVLTATFEDADPPASNDDYALAVNWGDGSTSTSTSTSTSSNNDVTITLAAR
jgi:hypothetical protein